MVPTDPTDHAEPTLDPLERERQALQADLRRELRRARRKEKNIASDLKRTEQREQLRAHAELIVAHLYRLKDVSPGSQFEVLDYRETPPKPLVFSLEPRQTAQQKSEDLFRRARKLERTEQIARERLQAARARSQALRRGREQLGDAPSLQSLARLRESLRIPERQAPPEQRRRVRAERVPYRSFVSGTLEIRVGRGAKENDTLTLHHAKPHDLWLHVRGTPGSHVVLRLRRGQQPPPEALLDAATLAVHFSNARQKHATYATPVEVQYTERRFVRKVRKAPPGQVLVQREKVILLEVEPERLKRLLESER